MARRGSDPSARWAGRAAWVLAAAFVGLVLAGLAIESSPLEELAEPPERGFPTGGGAGDRPDVDDPRAPARRDPFDPEAGPANESAEDPAVREVEPPAGEPRRS